MSKCCRTVNPVNLEEKENNPCCCQQVDQTQEHESPVAEISPRFAEMIDNAYDYMETSMTQGKPIVGILCEYTPRELVMAAGGVPICLCGGDQDMIPAAEAELPSMLCPLIKSTYGYLLNKANPFLENASLVIAETTCDGKKKMYELMGRHVPMHVLELPQKEDSPEALELWIQELRKLKQVLEDKFNKQITDDDLRAAIQTMNKERSIRMKLASLMQKDAAPLNGSQLLELKSIASGNPEDQKEYERIYEDLKDKSCCSNKNRPRVLITGVPMPHGAERVVHLIEECGGLIVAQENCTGIKPIIDNIDETENDPLIAIAKKYFHLPCSVMTQNTGREKLLRKLIEDYRPDCIIDIIWQACLTYDVESVRIKALAKELELPYLRINTDYSPHDSARLAVRIEALLESCH